MAKLKADPELCPECNHPLSGHIEDEETGTAICQNPVCICALDIEDDEDEDDLDDEDEDDLDDEDDDED